MTKAEELRASVREWAKQEKARIKLRTAFLRSVRSTTAEVHEQLVADLANECVETIEDLFA